MTETALYTILDAVESFITNLKIHDRSPKTVAWYSEMLTGFTRWAQARDLSTIDQLTSESIRAYFQYILEEHANKQTKKKGLSQGTRAAQFRALRALFNYLVEEEWLKESPMRRMQSINQPKEPVEPFEPEEFQKLIGKIPRQFFIGLRDYTLTWLLFDTGLRISEALSLTEADINLMGLFLQVTGKGNKKRIVPFGLMTRKILFKYLDRRRRKEALTDKIFITRRGLPLSKRAYGKSLKIYGDRARITRVRVSPHTLRHTFAIQYLMNGGDVYSLKEMLGHESLEMTMKYLKFSQSMLKERHRKASPGDALIRKDN